MGAQGSALIGPPVEDRDLVLVFFFTFSRFEYALKASGLVVQGRFGEAVPDWNSYTDQLRGRFQGVRDPRFVDACAYLRNDPPRKQVIANNRLDWQKSRPGPRDYDERYLLCLVRTIRNNLFHGGKMPFGVGPDPDAARNRRLLEIGIVVLEQCLSLSPRVRGSYEGAA